MSKAGRRRSVVWECFFDHPSSGKRRVLCRFCQHDTVANPVRMVRHIVKYCPNADEKHKKICRDYQSLTIPARRRSQPHELQSDDIGTGTGNDPMGGTTAPALLLEHQQLHPLTATSGQGTNTSKLNLVGLHLQCDPSRNQQASRLGRMDWEKMLQQHRMESTSPVVTSNHNHNLDTESTECARDELVLAIITGEIPWSFLENHHLQRALQLLRPQFAQLTTRDAAHHVFPRLYERTRSEMEQFLKTASSLTILCIIVPNVNGQHTAKWIAVNQEFRSELIAMDEHAAKQPEHPEKKMANIVQFLQQIPRNSSTLLHFCNDAFAEGQTIRRMLWEATTDTGSSTGLTLTGGCMVQQTLFLFRVTLETLTCVNFAMTKCMEVVSFIKSSKALYRELKSDFPARHQQRQPFRLMMPSADDLLSFFTCVNQLLGLKKTLQRVLAPETTANCAFVHFDSESGQLFMNTVKNDSFWMCLEFTKEVLKPFVYAMALSESSDGGNATASSAQFMLCWLWLHGIVNLSSLVVQHDKESFIMKLVDHIRNFTDDHVLACLLLDPRTHGLALSAHGRRKTRLIVADLAMKLNPSLSRFQLVEQLIKYLNRERPFNDEESWKMMQHMPRLFWIEFATEAPELASVALAVLSFRSHLLPVEESWRMVIQQHQHSQHMPAVKRVISSLLVQQPPHIAGVQLAQVKHHHGEHELRRGGPTVLYAEKYRQYLDLWPLESKPESTTSASDAGGAAPTVSDLLGVHDIDSSLSSLIAAEDQHSVKGGDLFEVDDDNGPTKKTYLISSVRADIPTTTIPTVDEDKRDDGNAIDTFGQFKMYLQSINNHAQQNVSYKTKTPLHDFDADWLELSLEVVQHVRQCVERFLLGEDSSRRNILSKDRNEARDAGTVDMLEHDEVVSTNTDL